MKETAITFKSNYVCVPIISYVSLKKICLKHNLLVSVKKNIYDRH